MAGPVGAAPPEEPGWAETALFSLRFEEIRTCTPSAAQPGRIWMGAVVRARSKSNDLFVTARDFSLEKGGIILAGRHVDPPVLARCQPLFPARQLKARQSVRGFVLFEVPAAFRGGDKHLVLAYRPTRFGGGPRVEFPIPACLDACGDAKVTREGELRPR
jgi:hypothetical protein